MANNKWYVSDKKSDTPWTEREYDYRVGGDCIETESTYDTSGLLTSRTICSDEGLLTTTTYSYDNNGTLLSSVEKFGGNYYESLMYDGNGNVISGQHYFDKGDPYYNIQYSYDSNGNKMSEVTYNDGSIEHIEKYTYDDNNNLVESLGMHSDGSPEMRRVCTYDDVGNKTSEIRYYGSDDFLSSWDYKYDKDGNMIERSYTDSRKNGEKIVDKYVYNEIGQKIKESGVLYDADGELHDSVINYGYDKDGNVTRVSYLQDDKLIGEKLYSYDANGNRTSREEYNIINGERRLVEYKEECGYDDAGNRVGTWEYNSDGTLNKHWTAKEMTFGGQVYTFNASELTSIAISLGSSNTNFSSILSSISSTCGSIAGTVSSADSGLSGTLNSLADLCNSCDTQISRLLTNLSNDINSYVTKTVASETETAKELSGIAADIASAQDIIDNLGNQ